MNRAAELANTLGVLSRHPSVRPPTVVIDNGSTDETGAVLRRHQWLRSIRLEHNLGGAARNLGVRALDTEFVAFFDDDTWPEPEALTRAATKLRVLQEKVFAAAMLRTSRGCAGAGMSANTDRCLVWMRARSPWWT